jgi:N-formylglutamate deformylase
VSTIVLHIPHSSREIPPRERGGLLLSEDDLSRELLALTDAWTDELFPVTVHERARVVFPVSRLVCDPERFTKDDDEPMSRVGMGAVYTRTSGGARLRREPDKAERERILERWYRPHHAVLTLAVQGALDSRGRALVVDCHSFPAQPLPYESDRRPDRPDICLGADSFHTPVGLLARALRAVRAEGWSVRVNSPFAGALVPLSSYRRETRVKALMIEVNRRLVQSETTGERAPGFAGVQAALGRVLEAISLEAEEAEAGP